MSEVENEDAGAKRHAADDADSATLRETPPTPEVAQQPGFKVLDKQPSRGGMKLVWTALVVAVAIYAAYYFGVLRFFR